jgi:DNA topoisomerase-1
MKLMIVESPNKVRKIKAILSALGPGAGGGSWDVAASVGHIRDLPVKELGLAMPGYVPQYELSGRGADVVKTLRARAAKAEQVYLATDPDREGEAIAWHLVQALKLKDAQRVSFDAITPEVIRKALERPRSVDAQLVHAQEARRVLDRLVGYQVSPVLSRQTGRRGLSAGRVQSPAVRLVVEREREIAAFRETRHFGAELLFDGNAWRAQWETAPFLKKDEKNGDPDDPARKYILDEALAARAAACRECRVVSSGNRVAKQAPPPPFTTSTLLQAASVRLHWKPEVTAGVAQRLFEAGLITYHRTDSQNMSAEALREVRGYAEKRGLPVPASARQFRARSGAQEAHEAIRPTHFADEQAGEDGQQQALYRLIWQRAVASQLADAEWSVNTTRLEAKGESEGKAETFTFKAEGRVLLKPGWLALTARDEAEEDEDKDGESCGRVPVLEPGAPVRAEDGRVLHKKTQPPARYTQASLIKKLESLGIGRPSTYPSILKNVMARGYLEEEKRLLRPTELGCVVIDALSARFSFVEYAFTRDLEQQLDDIAEGKAQYLPVVSAADERLQREIAALGTLPARAPFSAQAAWGGRNASVGREGSEGGRNPRLKRETWGTRGSSAGGGDGGTAGKPARTRAAKRVRAKAADGAAPVAKTTRAKRGRKAAPAGGEPSSAGMRNAEGAAALCPACKAGFVRLPREDAKFYGCSAYASGCRFTVWRTIAGRALQPAEIAALCRDGRTGKLSGFLSKAGRPFEAALVLNGEGRVEFAFR